MAEPVLNGRPRQQPGTQMALRDGHAVVVAGEGGDLCALNATAFALWELCDGATSVEEMVEAVCELWDTSQEVAVPDVVAALRALADAGAIVWS